MVSPTRTIRVSVVVPVYNNPSDLHDCLSALIASQSSDVEILVVDDGSTDATPLTAAQLGITVLRLPRNSGPSAARNYGVRHARGEIIFFVDADVVVMPGAVGRIAQLFKDHPDVAAVFGSYDARPRARGVVSQYRNLLHHFVHQSGNCEASTFWAGCGGIRREVFEQIGGFDEKRFARRIEDIELGYRLREAGYRILLDKGLQGTHLKRWTLRSMIRTDVFYRAVPWAQLILASNKAPHDLNLKSGQRLSIVLAGLIILCLGLAPFGPAFLHLSAAALLGVIFLNRDLYAFFLRERGLFFSLACIPLHLLYYLYGGLSYACVWLGFRLRGTVASR